MKKVTTYNHKKGSWPRLYMKKMITKNNHFYLQGGLRGKKIRTKDWNLKKKKY